MPPMVVVATPGWIGADPRVAGGPPSAHRGHTGGTVSPMTVTEDITTTKTRDARTFWRLALAVLAPLPLLCMGVSYVLSPADGGASIAVLSDAMRAHPDRAAASMAFGLVFFLLIPAAAALAWVTRRRAPRLTTIGTLLTLPALLLAFPLLPGGDEFAWAVATRDLAVGPVQQLEDVLWTQPVVEVTILLFLLAITVGLPLMGAAMLRAKVAPAWMAICLIAGTSTHIFLPGHTLKGIGLLVGGIGFLGVSRALLRMRDDEFDLPPVRQLEAGQLPPDQHDEDR
jgi:hypothetical protein